MNTINQRRWNAFKKIKRAYYALWIFSIAFSLSLCSEILANDKPLIVHYNTGWYFPIVEALTEKTFGGDFEFSVDYQDPLIIHAIKEHGFAIWPPIRYSYNTISQKQGISFPAAPSREHWLGTDDHGRDILARILYGFRISMLFGLCLAFFSCTLGTATGLVQGYYGGKVDIISQRLMEIWGGIPILYLIIIVSSMISMSFWILLGIMLIFGWMGLVSFVRAETLKIRNLEYIRAARALGVPDKNIMLRHILPNAMVAVVAMLPFQINGSIVMLTSLDFLGFGLPSSYPSLGEIIAQGKNNLYAPWIAFSGFFTLAGMLILLVFIGEGLRDALDPRVFLVHNPKEQK